METRSDELRETEGFRSGLQESDHIEQSQDYIPSLSLSTTLRELPREKSKSGIDPKRTSNSEARNEASIETLIDHGHEYDAENEARTATKRLRKTRRGERDRRRRMRGFALAPSSTLTSILSPGSCVPAAIECTRESSHVVPYRPDTSGLLAKTTSPVHQMGHDRVAEYILRVYCTKRENVEKSWVDALRCLKCDLARLC